MSRNFTFGKIFHLQALWFRGGNKLKRNCLNVFYVLISKRVAANVICAHCGCDDAGFHRLVVMALLRLSNPQPNEGNKEDPKITLSLSYIEKPEQPDAFQLKEDDF